MSTSLEANKALVRRFFNVIELGNLAEFDEIIGEKYDDHLPGQSPGREALKRYFGGLRAAFPDVKFPISQIIAEGDRVAVLNSVQGTQQGAFLGMEPSGRCIDVMAFQLYRIEAGQLVEHWEVADFASLIRQLGAPAKK
jgi:steroid delta-isomerase-like uncharacterized protein